MRGDELEMTLYELIGEQHRAGTRLSQSVVRAILEQLLAQLEAVHARDVVHGLIDPGCVRVSLRGDEVVATLEAFERAAQEDAHDNTERAFLSLGELTFVAPETYTGASNRTRLADLYGLGLIACVLLTGSNPYLSLLRPEDGESDRLMRVFQAKLSRSFDPLGVLDGAPWPSAVVSFLRTALARDPASRYRDVASFRMALARALEIV